MEYSDLRYERLRCERVDDRYRKRYGNELHMVASALIPWDNYHLSTHPVRFTGMEERITDSGFGQRDDFVKFNEWDGGPVRGDDETKKRRYFTVTLFVPADRPKEIVYEESDNYPEALNDLGLDTDAYLDIIRGYLDDWVAAYQQMQDWKRADHLVRELVSEARERAREITRHEQRLAALCAETDAEAEVQLKKLLDSEEWGPDATYDDTKEPVGRHIMGAIRKHAREYMTPHKHRGRMSSYQNKIPHEELKQEEGV